MIDGQTNIFEMLYPTYKITKPIRLIEFFAGYGSQALALKYLGVNFEHWKICEWAVKSIQAYKDIHFTNEDVELNKDRTKEEMIEFLCQKGISQNYNEPMTKQQISRLNENQLKTIIKNIAITHNLVNIQQVKGKDLEIVDADKYDYILTYSFPCQDLSLAGTRKLMSDTSTRSGMLWEVERILTECKELGTMPQILLMENVPQVHGEGAKEDFNKWQLRLEELGYKNYWQDLIATDYGIPQTRNRCFMVSILGDYNYTFPKPVPLKLKLKDMLEPEVDEKYYLSEKLINCFMSNVKMGDITRRDRFLQNLNRENQEIANSITTLNGSRITDTFIVNKGEELINTYDEYNKKVNGNETIGTIQAMYPVPHHGHRLVFQVNKPQVLGGIGEKKSNDGNQWYQHDRVYDDNVAITITTECNPYYKNDLKIRKLTPYECFALMGVKREDYEKIAKHQSDSSLYHLAGDSLVTLVFCAIISTMIENYKSFEQVLEEFYLQISN